MIAAPFLLMLSTYLIFLNTIPHFPEGSLGAYLGNLFYWLFWCVLFPLWAVGREGLAGVVRGIGEGKRGPGIAGWIVLSVPVLLPLYVVPLATASGVELPGAEGYGTGLVLWMAVLVTSLLNGVLEEILWRGTYLAAFPQNRVLGLLFPSVMFGLWHLSPFSFLPGTGAVELLVISMVGIIFGLCWGIVAWRTGTIRWSIYSHILSNIVLIGTIVAMG